MKDVIKTIVDELAAKMHQDRQNAAHLGYPLQEEFLSYVTKHLPKKKIKKVGKFKLGSEFIVPAMVKREYTYKIVKFFTENTVVGKSSNDKLNQGNGYYPSVILPISEIKKAKKIKLKPVKIKKGEYFSLKNVNIIYKATNIDGKYVEGSNKLELFENPKNIRVARTGIVLSTKKAYKKQHKVEKEHLKNKKI